MQRVAIAHRFDDGGFEIDVDFVLPEQGVTALFGPSGCGKSTILAAVSGLLRPRDGHVELGGVVLLDTRNGVCVAPERRRCGVVFQDSRLFPHMTVEQNLRYGLKRAPPDANGPDFSEVVTILGIAALLGRRPGMLSGGERQRVALGRALLSRPRVLLMDEPLAALDAERRAEVLPFIARIRDATRLPVLYVTHALDEVDALADHLVLMDRGRVLAAGTAEEIAARTDLPLASRRDAGVLLGCTVIEAGTSGLTRLGFDGGELVATIASAPPGTRLRARLRARDVSIAIVEPKGLSTQNVLHARIEAIVAAGEPHEVFVRLAVGGSTLLARITRDSVDRLALSPGMSVWALIKAVTFDRRLATQNAAARPEGAA